MRSKFIFIPLLFSFLSGFTAAHAARFTYRYDLSGNGSAPTTLNIEGWNAKLSQDCKTNASEGTFRCTGLIDVLLILPSGNGGVLVRGPVTSTNVRLQVFQKCVTAGELLISGLTKEMISNPYEGLFYNNLEVALNPCGNEMGAR